MPQRHDETKTLQDLDTTKTPQDYKTPQKLRDHKTKTPWRHNKTMGHHKGTMTQHKIPQDTTNRKQRNHGNFLACFCHFKVPYRPPSDKILSYSCRGGSNLWFAWSYIKIEQELPSEISKWWGKLQMLISLERDKISKFQIHIWNQWQILHQIDVVL